MATLALAAGGALLGGATGLSFGASVGWAVGGLAGSLLFPPKGQDSTGPRLSDLSVQSSAYGTGIPVLFGTMRLAGNIIWSSGLREQASRRRVGGKGTSRTTATSYSYSASWAVGLCEGPAAAVRRIWFDDKLVFDASGASLSIEVPGLTWRFYPDDETQLPDPLIEAAVGPANAVAHRGLCYVVFEEVPLDRLGNRLPNVTCEVVMAGGLAVTDEAITGRPSPMLTTLAAIDWAGMRLWTVSDTPRRIVETNLSTLTSRILVQPALGPSKIAFLPGLGLVTAGISGSSGPVERFDADTGALTGTFGTGSGISNSTTRVSSLPNDVQTFVPLQVIGNGRTRSFVLMTPLTFEAGGYCVDVDTMAYVWGSTQSGHPRLFVPTATGGWVVGEQRDGETDAYFVSGRTTGIVEIWRVTVTIAAAGIVSGTGIGGTTGVFVTKLPDLAGAALGHVAGALIAQQAFYDAEDATLILQTSRSSDYRLAKVTRDRAVLWHAPGTFSQSGMSHLSRLDSGQVAILGTNLVRTYSTRTGALLATQAVPASASVTSGWQIHDGSLRALYSATTASGARRLLVLRQDSTPVSLASIAAALCTRAGLSLADINTAALGETVAGYVVARPMSARAALEPLAGAYRFDAVERDDALHFVLRGGSPVATLAHADLARIGEQAVISETRAQDVELPRQLTVRHFNPERSYETGAQHWQRPATPSPTMRSREVQTLDLPIVMPPDAAKAVARRLLTATWRERTRLSLVGTTQRLRLEPTDPVTLAFADGTTQRARIIATQLGADWTLRIEAVAEAAADYALTAPADGGRGYAPDAMPAPYGIRALVPNLPLLRDGDDLAGTGLRGYALAGTYGGQSWRASQLWRGALASLELLGAIDQGMAWGGVVGAVAVPASYWSWDDVTAIVVAPASGGERIVSATDLEVLNGANLGLLVSPAGVVEVIQHATATANGDGTITLTRLLRGRRGTEDAGAFTSAVYVLLDDVALRYAAPLGALNAAETYRVQGAFQQVQEALTLTRSNTGRAERPYAPAQIRGARDGSLNLTITWVRRTRLGGEWLDWTGDVPLGEATEAYEVLIRNAGDTATLRTITGLSAPTTTYTAAQQTTDLGATQAAVNVQIYQISGAVGRGIAGRATI